MLIRFFEERLKGRKTFSYWAELENSQWRDASEIERHGVHRLRQLLSHARSNCEFYRDSWRALGLDPDGIQELRHFVRWPILERATVREHAGALKAVGLSFRRMRKTTGGSSGVPLEFEIDERSYQKRMAAMFRGYAWAGAGPGTRQLYLWGTSPVPESFASRLKTTLYDRLYRRKVLSAFELGDESMPRFLETVRAWRPDVIVAYTNALHAIARRLKELNLSPPPPRSIVVGAEKLHEHQRALIEEVFRAPVFETYGSREFTLVAAQCERRQGLHISAENLIVEIVDERGRAVPDGSEGRVLVTDLFNYAMPFIRYATGDRAVAGGQCDCGRGLPLLREVVGRQADILVTPDGRRVPGLFFPHLLKDVSAVQRFQVVQPQMDEVILKLIAPGANAEDIEGIETAARAVLGPRVRFSIERVTEIPLTRSGKLLVVASRVNAGPADPV